MKHGSVIIVIFLSLVVALPMNSQESDKDRLSIAIDYFQGGKYHEALLILQQLDKLYELNPRVKAYLGVCYFKEWMFAEAVTTLEPVIARLEVYAPQERSVYYYSAAESYFQLGQYERAIPFFEQMLNVCHPDERADALYRLGFCYLNLKDRMNALEFFTSALAYYTVFPSEERRQQTEQLKHMIADLAQNLQQR